MQTIFKVFLEFVTTLLLCYVLVYDHEIEPARSASEDKVLTKSSRTAREASQCSVQISWWI